MNRVTEEYRQWWTQMSQALRAREWVGLLVVGVIGGVVYVAIPLFAVLVLLGVIR